MTVRLTHDVFCDNCGNWVHAFVSGNACIRDARTVAHNLDWVTRKTQGGIMVDLCPECAEQWEEICGFML